MLEEIAAPLLSTEWGRRTGLGLMILFGVFLLITLIKAPMNLYSDYTLTHGSAKYAGGWVQIEDEAASLIASLPKRHLFGSAENQIIPVTSLQLHLIGVIKGSSESTSQVIISEQGRLGKVYRIGDTLTSGVKVHGITADEVILENGGRLEKLPLERAPLMFEAPPKSFLGE